MEFYSRRAYIFAFEALRAVLYEVPWYPIGLLWLDAKLDQVGTATRPCRFTAGIEVSGASGHFEAEGDIFTARGQHTAQIRVLDAGHDFGEYRFIVTVSGDRLVVEPVRKLRLVESRHRFDERVEVLWWSSLEELKAHHERALLNQVCNPGNGRPPLTLQVMTPTGWEDRRHFPM